tara:strand:+ start:46 stop:369 length:324 start_codon:yes stop_codon:yes gene_type:complete
LSKSDSFIDEHSLASKSSGLDAVGLGWTRRHCGRLEVVPQHAQSRSRMDLLKREKDGGTGACPRWATGAEISIVFTMMMNMWMPTPGPSWSRTTSSNSHRSRREERR